MISIPLVRSAMTVFDVRHKDLGADNATHFEALAKVYSAAATQRFCGVRQPPPCLGFHIYIYIYMYIYLYVYIYVYRYIDRWKDRYR